MTDKLYKIKKLEWEESNGWYYSFKPTNNYKIVDDGAGYRALYVIDYITNAADSNTLEEAKAAAQEHHEAELSKHLEVVSAKSVVCTRCNDAEVIAPGKLCTECFIEIMNKE